jgi:hypothetical protein
MCGELVKSGSIGAKEVLLALVLGGFTFLITQDYPRGAFPLYASIYPTKTAVKFISITNIAKKSLVNSNTLLYLRNTYKPSFP